MPHHLSKSIIPVAERKPLAWRSAAGVALAISLSLGACATDSTSRNTGERLSDRGNEIGAYGTSWSEGKNNVQKAEKSIEKSNRSLVDGERDLARARKDLAKAERQISDASAIKAAALQRIQDGKMQMTRAEADYARTKAGPSAVTPKY